MKSQHTTWKNFLIGGGGYTLGALAGLLLVMLISRIELGKWMIGWITPDQPLLKILWALVVTAFLLGLSGAVVGGVGGYALRAIMGLKHRSQTIVGSAITYALISALIIITFLLLLSFIGVYNNFTTNRGEHYGILFGLFGLVYGLVAGVLQGLMTVKLRHSWRIILASVLGFTLGGVLLGLLARWMNPTKPDGPALWIREIVLAIGLLLPFFMSGGFLGIVHGKLAERAKNSESPARYVLPTKWQTYLVAGIGLAITLSVLGFLSTLAGFLTVNPAPLAPHLQRESVGVQWTPARAFEGSVIAPLEDQTRVTVRVGEVEYQAWCGENQMIYYQAGSAAQEQILEPPCSDLPALAVDSQGQAHLVWYTEEIVDATGNARPIQALVESIRTPAGWSEPSIAALTQKAAIPNLSLQSDGSLRLTWTDASKNTYFSIQEMYECDPDSLTRLERIGLDAVLAAGLRTEETLPQFCRNEYVRMEYTPNPAPSFSDEEPTLNSAFDQIAALANTAEYEVLFTTMQYEQDTAPPSPGKTLADAVAELYVRVRDNPEKYPRGMTVRILLGNYPNLSTFTYGDQIIEVLSDLREAGVEKLVDPEIGWRLEVANYAGTYPHSHTKFIVVDGKSAISVGFNYGYLHLPKDHPSGKGYDMMDSGIWVTGPVAQDMIAAFDDLWNGADQVQCDFHPQNRLDWMETCENSKAVPGHVPEVLRTYIPPGGESHFFSLYRTAKYPEADIFIAAVLGNAQESIDMMHVNFSMEAYCMLNLVYPELCTVPKDALPWMDALIQSIETNQAHVRVIMENTNSNGLENRVAAQALMDELTRRGYEDYIEFRFYNGKLHAKTTLIDDSLLIIGSQNMHYSSWGDRALTEHSLATSDEKAIADYQRLFEVKWAEAIPYDEAVYGTSP